DAGMVCAFSRDDEEILGVSNFSSGKKAQARIFRRNSERHWQAAEMLDSFDDYAIACSQNKAGEWLVLTTCVEKQEKQKNHYLPQYPLTAHNLTVGKKTALPALAPWGKGQKISSLLGASISEDGSKVYILDPDSWWQFDVNTGESEV